MSKKNSADFKHRTKKLKSGEKIDQYTNKTDDHKIVLSYFNDKLPYENTGGVLIDASVNETCVQAEVSLYLNRNAVGELIEILQQHLEGGYDG